MATYKVLQDIDAEDKLIWNLSLRQFIYAVIAIGFIYISYLCFAKRALYLIPVFMPFTLFFGFLAYPFGRDQPTEVWALAKLRFLIKPRKRIWSQDGLNELVTITVPKKVEVNLTDGLNQNEVRSRLQALAETIDSRGWAIKNVDNLVNPSVFQQGADRLINVGAMPEEIKEKDVHDFEDMMDESNANNQKMAQMIEQATSKHREELASKAVEPVTPAMSEPPVPSLVQPSYVDNPKPAQQPAELNSVKPVDFNRGELRNMRTLKPVRSTFEGGAFDNYPSQSAPAPSDIINLANDNNRSISSLAKENQVTSNDVADGNEEVVVSLH